VRKLSIDIEIYCVIVADEKSKTNMPNGFAAPLKSTFDATRTVRVKIAMLRRVIQTNAARGESFHQAVDVSAGMSGIGLSERRHASLHTSRAGVALPGVGVSHRSLAARSFCWL
jgi:hypothetical protein